MNATRWLPIKYREFHDVPRIFVAENEKGVFLFDCEFDADTDEYPPDYKVYVLANTSASEIDAVADWQTLPKKGAWVAVIKVADVKFDPTLRKFVDSVILDTL